MTSGVYADLCAVAERERWRVLLWANTLVREEERLGGDARITMLTVFAPRWNHIALVRSPGDSYALDAAAQQIVDEASRVGLIDPAVDL
jgi:hypothetical protein